MLPVVLVVAVGTYALRVAGPVLRDRVRVPPEGERLLSVTAVVLLASFVVVSALYESGAPAGAARCAGVAVGGVLAWRRAPFLVVVVVAAGVTAGLRVLGVS